MNTFSHTTCAQFLFFFFFNDTATTEIYTLSLHDALPISDCVNPAAYTAIRANGDKAWFGWPTSPTVEKEVANWFDAKSLDDEKAAVGRLNRAALEDVVYAPTGFFLTYTAWRTNVSGIAKGPLPFFWDVSKTA